LGDITPSASLALAKVLANGFAIYSRFCPIEGYARDIVFI
jgi:hypothetical protein